MLLRIGYSPPQLQFHQACGCLRGCVDAWFTCVQTTSMTHLSRSSVSRVVHGRRGPIPQRRRSQEGHLAVQLRLYHIFAVLQPEPAEKSPRFFGNFYPAASAWKKPDVPPLFGPASRLTDCGQDCIIFTLAIIRLPCFQGFSVSVYACFGEEMSHVPLSYSVLSFRLPARRD